MWVKGVSGNIKGRKREGTYAPCANCGKEVYRCSVLSRVATRFCSKKCSNNYPLHIEINSKRQTGRIVSPETKRKLAQYTGSLSSGWGKGRVGSLAGGWKGGRPTCPICGKTIGYRSKRCSEHKIFTKEHLMKLGKSRAITLSGKMPKNIQRPGKFGNVQRGTFDINGRKMFFRSKWEANYAIYLDFLKKQMKIKDWEYEKDVFIFGKIQSGTRSYRPDFKIKNIDASIEYHEIKGWLTPRSKTQFSRMKKYFPEIKLVVIDGEGYREIVNKLGRMLSFY
jgi:predicted RNA-binding Zn-ribbon protein involved in translation (DUF1610 family)